VLPLFSPPNVSDPGVVEYTSQRPPLPVVIVLLPESMKFLPAASVTALLPVLVLVRFPASVMSLLLLVMKVTGWLKLTLVLMFIAPVFVLSPKVMEEGSARLK